MVNSSLGFLFICSLFSVALGFPKTLPTLSFYEGYDHLYGDDHVTILDDGKLVLISLDNRSSSGIISQDQYLHGFFSASIKLPADYTAGVVVAFYTSNQELYDATHDELDFEFLGGINGQEWVVQTNIYGNGSTSRGREERYALWFDPTEDFHRYSIYWTEQVIRFYVDDVPIRVLHRNEDMGLDYPSKPMTMYATVWDGSKWATSGGKYKVDYRYAPFIAKFTDFVLSGCAIDPIGTSFKCDDAVNSEAIPAWSITLEERTKMENFRNKHLTYSYCYDRARYEIPLPECTIDLQELEQLRQVEPYKFGRDGI